MARSAARRKKLDYDVDRFCQDVEHVLTQIHQRIEETESKKKKKGKKKKDSVADAELIPYSLEPED